MNRVDLSRWAEIRAHFDEIVELDATQRDAHLLRIGRTDPELHAAVSSLLALDGVAVDQLTRFEIGVSGLLSAGADGAASGADPLGLLGRTVAHFRILELVAAGGMGVVYRAEDMQLHRAVAVKFPLPYHAVGRSVKERFLHEARSAGALDHPNLCSVYEAGESETGHCYLAMPLYPGETLKAKLESARMPIPEALDIARQIGEGLACAHAAGIVHRDLKPGNVMVLPDGAVKILDFGLAKVTDLDRTLSRSMFGTAGYMAPEQIRGGTIDGRTDLWALGVVLYEMLVGERPFSGETDVSIAHAVVHDEPTPPSLLRPGIPDGVERIVLSLLQKDPANRYPGASSVAADLAAVQCGEAPAFRYDPRNAVRSRVGVRRVATLLVPTIIVAAVGVLLLSTVWRGDRSTASGREPERAPAAIRDGATVPRTVAVLPFTNLSGDPQDQYFSDGLTEELISSLSQIQALRVIARSSSFAFRDQNQSARDVGHALGAGIVVEGSVQKYGERVRVSAQVSHAADGVQIWSQTFERKGTDLLAIQSELARRIATALEAELTPGERRRLQRKPTSNAEAYNFYLKGVYFGHQRSRAALDRAIEYFERAIAADSQFAGAYAGLANVFPPFAVHGFISRQEGKARMRAPAFKAVALDPDLADAQVALGAYLQVFEWDWSRAEKAYLRAIELDPNDARAHGWYSYMLVSLRRHEEAIREATKQAELSPLGPFDVAAPGVARLLAGQAEGALEPIRNGIELDSTVWLVQMQMGWAHEIRKEWDQAIRTYEGAARLAGPTLIPRADIARVYALEGRTAEARELLTELRAQSARTGDHLPQISTIHAALGEKAAAVQWLEASAREHHPLLPHALIEPGFGSILSDPRVVTLLRRYGLPAAGTPP